MLIEKSDKEMEIVFLPVSAKLSREVKCHTNMRRILLQSTMSRFLGAALLLSVLQWAAATTSGATVAVGGTARDFTLNEHKTGQPVRLSDFAGKIIFLDMFAYW